MSSLVQPGGSGGDRRHPGPLACGVCGYQASTPAGLQAHVKAQHKVIYYKSYFKNFELPRRSWQQLSISR